MEKMNIIFEVDKNNSALNNFSFFFQIPYSIASLVAYVKAFPDLAKFENCKKIRF